MTHSLARSEGKFGSSTNCEALPVLIWASELKRVPCTVPAGVVHSAPALGGCAKGVLVTYART